MTGDAVPRTVRYAAVDLGAASGRVVLGQLADGRVTMDEAHRFANRPLRLPSGLHWNVGDLYTQVLEGIRCCATRVNGRLDGIGVDAWAVDFALLDGDGALLGLPFHYRDARTDGMVARLCERVPADSLYEATGIQFMPINTVCQLLAMESGLQLRMAERLLTIPDLLNYWLCGRAVSERTVASTTQMLGLDGTWAEPLLSRLGLPVRLLPEVVDAGTVLGPLREEVRAEAGLRDDVPVIAVAAHDTASAVAAVPALVGPVAFISSGTWSLVGLEVDAPVVSALARRYNVSNEAGVCGTVRLLTNVMGLWLLQECRRAWAAEGRDYDWDELVALARERPSAQLIDPDDPALLAPGDMPTRIATACRDLGQAAPRDDADVVRCVLDSLACKQRLALERVEEVAGRRAEVVHLVGGGVHNALLCQVTADLLGRPLHAGPVEATALGNVMMQALAQGHVDSLHEIRRIVADSVDVTVYTPSAERDRCEELYARWCSLVEPAAETPSEPTPEPMKEIQGCIRK